MTTLELHGIEASYANSPKAGKPVLTGIELRLGGGEVLALIGPNGAGKTTLLRVASGALRPSAGSALLDGADLSSLSARERARQIAVVPQDGPILSGLFVREMVSLGRTPYTRALLGPTASPCCLPLRCWSAATWLSSALACSFSSSGSAWSWPSWQVRSRPACSV